MRKIFGFVFLLVIAGYVKFGNTVTDVDYNVKTAYGDLPTHLVNMGFAYHVPGVVRIAGADIYRPEGYFAQSVVKLPREGVAAGVGVIVKAMTIGVPTKLDAKKAKLLGLEPAFTFWEDSGKWILLFGVVCLLFAFFWR